ncbi:hypothetical protein Clole_0806 [Cellulosilyticum lentocellum DSM 5427]|uniref:Uncharacterized protein n=1 Tax=Cellulosilyticum lentocellum (strain ATCC 49066 / DSM 5427 / NCIMB 11756 / RHM5) TaxID=642492 RepID=F2JPJ1_CELLD|nr:hypothetical protein Clole_0806 [Cellulosilyticum lentocellum DSM 5427]
MNLDIFRKYEFLFLYAVFIAALYVTCKILYI